MHHCVGLQLEMNKGKEVINTVISGAVQFAAVISGLIRWTTLQLYGAARSSD
jgi:hypothetical protein